MEALLREAYETAASQNGGKVAHAGVAMLEMYKKGGIMDVYDDDLYHPSYYGSLLIAYTLFAEIFEIDPREISYNGNIGYAFASTFKEVAYNAAFGEDSGE